ncbi:Rhomboid protease GluP [Pseudoruegeria aquimaris]|uniref:Rhomboid protease GluP n=1 Tax=Pseudoruegeria aquimaris TaxID=393663 RepID=A0A1Y5TDT3_9RHOB|nr:rhomboid family intramembrane serine protease [Pseudoruegeria aquimaris]SLN61842.1 Rhomboid protease GluP [Pseudoruegeria aquimaris]
MFPIRDHNPSQRPPVVTLALIAANVLIFLGYWGLLADPFATAAFYDRWAMRPGEIVSGQDLHTLLTSMFLHGSVMHLAGNMLFLWVFGDNLEDTLGHLRFLLFYLLCGVAAAFAHVLAAPASGIPTVGASGAIAGVMGGYLLLYPKARVDVLFIFIVVFKIIPIPAWVVLGVWLGLQLFNGIATDITGGGIAYWAHAGGFAIGFVALLPFWLNRGGPAYWRRHGGHPPHPEASYSLSPSRIPTVRRRR